MLAKKYRLTRKQVNYIYRKGKTKSFGDLSVKFLPNREEYARFSVVIPKSLVKKVTERNRLRRIIFDELAKTKAPAGDYTIRLFKVSDEPVIRQKIKDLLQNLGKWGTV